MSPSPTTSKKIITTTSGCPLHCLSISPSIPPLSTTLMKLSLSLPTPPLQPPPPQLTGVSIYDCTICQRLLPHHHSLSIATIMSSTHQPPSVNFKFNISYLHCPQLRCSPLLCLSIYPAMPSPATTYTQSPLHQGTPICQRLHYSWQTSVISYYTTKGINGTLPLSVSPSMLTASITSYHTTEGIDATFHVSISPPVLTTSIISYHTIVNKFSQLMSKYWRHSTPCLSTSPIPSLFTT